MRNKAGYYWQKLTNLWQTRYELSWQPRHLVVLSLLFGTTLAVSTSAYISYQIVRGLILDNLKQNSLLEIQRGRDEIDRWLAIRKAEVETIANSPIVRTLDWSVVEPYLKSESERLKEDFFGFAISESDGVLYNTMKGRTNINVKDRRYFQQAMAGKIYVSDPMIGRTSKVPSVAIAAPLMSIPPDIKQPIGVATGNIRLDRLDRVVGSLQYGAGSYAFALNSLGVPIVHPDAKVVGNGDKPAPSFLRSLDPTLAAIALRMVNHQNGLELVQIDGKSVYIAYLPLQEVNWSIALVIPRANLEKQLHALNVLALFVGILLTVAMIAVILQVYSSEQTRARAEREALLNRLTGRIRASLDLDTILQTTVEEIGTLQHLEWANFGWYDPKQVSLEFQWEYSRSGLKQLVGRFNLSPITDAQTLLANRLEMQLTQETAEEPLQVQLKAYHYLALPIHTQGLALGYLICTRATFWQCSQGELELLQAVADSLAIAITQSQLYTQTSQQVKLLDKAFKQLQTTQLQLVQSEKMSSLGQLVAGIAHEINNPVNFIHGNLSHVNEHVDYLLKLLNLYQQALPKNSPEIREFAEQIELEFLQEDLPKILNSMKIGTERIRYIVLSLRNFSRLDESDKKSVDIHEGIENTLLLLQNRLSDKITVVKHYGDLPLVECYASQINQVFMNLLTNAIDALEEGNRASGIGKDITNYRFPNIEIRTEVVERDKIAIIISDNGPGIPDEIKAKIFDPFFTTKPVGKGTGLGLAISYQIVVQVHGGKISVSKPPQGGTEFVVEIPIKA